APRLCRCEMRHHPAQSECHGGCGTRRAGCGLPEEAVNRPYQLSRGFRASRSQSPSRLTERTSKTRARPGKMVIHHSPEKRKSLPTRMRVPSEGEVGGTPTPRKERVASVMIAVAR